MLQEIGYVLLCDLNKAKPRLSHIIFAFLLAFLCNLSPLLSWIFFYLFCFLLTLRLSPARKHIDRLRNQRHVGLHFNLLNEIAPLLSVGF